MVIGTDLTQIARFRRIFARFGPRFLDKIYTPGEQAYCLRKRDPIPSLAARFAAKEACFKALGGSRRPHWRDMEVRNDENGRPGLFLLGRMAEMHGSPVTSLSLTHDGDYAMATVLLLR